MEKREKEQFYRSHGRDKSSLPSVIRINVGGVHYETLLVTLRAEESMLSSMFSGQHKLERDKDGCPFIDRPGEHFGYILNYLRDRSMMPPNDIAMQVYIEAQYYQIPTLITKLESTPDVFRYRLMEMRKKNLKNFEILKQLLIEHAQSSCEESLTLLARVNLLTSSDKEKLENPCECVINEHCLSIPGASSRHESIQQVRKRLTIPNCMIIEDGPNFNMKLFMDIVEKELLNEGYNCKIWVENLKCLYTSHYNGKECRFEIDEYIAEFRWK